MEAQREWPDLTESAAITASSEPPKIGSPAPKSQRWILPIFVAILIVLAGTIGFGLGYWLKPAPVSSTKPNPAPANPFLNVSVLGESAGAVPAPLANASVDVFSVNPAIVGTSVLTDLQGLSSKSNQYYNEIDQGTTGESGNLSFAVPPAWSGIASTWAASSSPLTTNVSVRVDVTFAREIAKGFEVYHTSENVPFDPTQPTYPLSARIVLDLANPATILGFPSNESRKSSCGYSLTATWTDSVISTSHGRLPLAWLDDNASSSRTIQLFMSDFWGQFQSVTIGMPSVQVYGSSVSATSSPSWSGTLPQFGYAESSIFASQINASSDGAALVMDNVSLLAISQSENVSLSAPNCPTLSEVVPVVTVSVPSAFTSSDLNQCVGPFCEESWLQAWTIPSSWTYLMATLPNQTIVSSAKISPEGSTTWSSLATNATGLSAASQAQGSQWGTNYTFPANLGEGLLYMDLPYGCDNTNCSSFCSICVDSELGAQLGFALPFIRAMAPIAFVVPHGLLGGLNEVQDIGLSYHTQNGGDPSIRLKLEGSGTPTSVTIGPRTFSYTAPSSGVVACPENVTLEPWAEC